MRIYNNRCLKEIKELQDYVEGLVITGGGGLTPDQVEALNQVTTNKNAITNLSTDISALTKTVNSKAEQSDLNSLSDTVNGLSIPTKISELDNDSKYLSESDVVDNLMGETGVLPLSDKQGGVLEGKIIETNNNILFTSHNFTFETLENDHAGISDDGQWSLDGYTPMGVQITAIDGDNYGSIMLVTPYLVKKSANSWFVYFAYHCKLKVNTVISYNIIWKRNV